MLLLKVLAQVPAPTDPTGVGAYMWISGILSVALGTVSFKLFTVLVKDRDEWKAHAKELASALALTTDTLRKATEVVEASHEDDQIMMGSIVRLEEKFEAFVKRAS